MPDYEFLLITLLVMQGIGGGTDTLFNHELLERLPARVEARSEIGLHALREAVYAVLFAAVAWHAWHGAWGYAIAALLAVEILIDAIDEWVENQVRVLPQNERMLHFLMDYQSGADLSDVSARAARLGATADSHCAHESWAEFLAALAALARRGLLGHTRRRRMAATRPAARRLTSTHVKPAWPPSGKKSP